MSEKKSDEAILFPEVTIPELEGLVLRPWTFGNLLDVNPFLEAIFERIESKGILLDFTMIGIKEIKELYFAAAPQLLKIICITTNKSEEEIRNLDLKIIAKLLYIIWNQNGENVKNGLSLLGLTAAEEIKEEVSSESAKAEPSV